MNKLTYVLLLIFITTISCTHTSTENLSKKDTLQLYQTLNQEIRTSNAKELKECNCMKALYRDLTKDPDNTARYEFDKLVGENALKLAKNQDKVKILAIGSGTLLNELSALANILARGKNLDIYLTDWAYIFYEDPNFKKQAISYGKNKKLIPQGWQGFFFWDWYANKKEPYLPFFEKHHSAIEQFKTIMGSLDQQYNTKTNIYVLKPPTTKAIQVPELDIIISIDAFIDLPELIFNLFYKLKLPHNKQVRFLALNKTKPLGGFWDSPDLSVREEYSLQTVSIDIYDVNANQKQGHYKLISKKTFTPNKFQVQNAPEFKINPKRDSTQSPLDQNPSP